MFNFKMAFVSAHLGESKRTTVLMSRFSALMSLRSGHGDKPLVLKMDWVGFSSLRSHRGLAVKSSSIFMPLTSC